MPDEATPVREHVRLTWARVLAEVEEASDWLEEVGEALGDRIQGADAKITIGFPPWLRLVLMQGVVAITLGRRIYLSPVLVTRGRERFEKILQHELAHVRQVTELGLIRFLWRYAYDYLRLRRQGLSSHEAYLRIPFEIEARLAESNVAAHSDAPRSSSTAPAENRQ